MTRLRRGGLLAVTLAVLAVGGVLASRALRSQDRARWPDRVAVVGIDESNKRQPVTFIGVTDPVRRAVVVVPTTMVVEVPGAGFLRAFHAYRLGGVPKVRATLERLLGVEIPFSVTGRGSDYAAVVSSSSSAEILPERVDDLRRALRDSITDWQVLDVRGERHESLRGPYVVPDPGSVAAAARALGGRGTKVFADPAQLDIDAATPTPAVAPSEITVEVLNGGPVPQAATKTAEKLRNAGFALGRIGDLKPQDRPASYVYAAAGAMAKARVVAAALGYPVGDMPADLKSSSDVLVVLGSDAKV